MKKITVITGSPRKAGNSNALAEAFIQSVEKAGAEVTRFDACKLNIIGCRACNGCYKNGHACAFEHGFDAVADAILASDVVVFTMPVYWFTVPGQIKSIIDHFYAFMVGGKDVKGKHCVVLATSGQPVDSGVHKGITDAMKGSSDFLGWSYEEHFFGNMNVPGAIRETDALSQMQEIAKRLAK